MRPFGKVPGRLLPNASAGDGGAGIAVGKRDFEPGALAGIDVGRVAADQRDRGAQRGERRHAAAEKRQAGRECDPQRAPEFRRGHDCAGSGRRVGVGTLACRGCARQSHFGDAIRHRFAAMRAGRTTQCGRQGAHGGFSRRAAARSRRAAIAAGLPGVVVIFSATQVHDPETAPPPIVTTMCRGPRAQRERHGSGDG
ncbi:MAG: hypothetical protein MZV70_63480 [Desulfobacterales bacterium]|nr:hypothetical protein [Desulfobacterales bacterium]